jgi:thiamine pyrophosphate-dependent acetolactate synthase large subunit-like protein
MGAERARSWLMPIGYGTLGCALPMAIGALVAAPDRPVLALAGDGGVLFTLQELATARDLRRPLPLVVWNNAGYGEIRDSMRDAGIAPLGTDATAMDFPAIARGFGCRGVRVDSPDELEDVVVDALHANAPTLIDAHGPWGGPA